MRLLLESSAIYSAAFNINPLQIAQLERILDQSKSHVKLKDISRERVLSRELHTAIVLASENALLQKMYITVLNTFPDWMLYEYLFRHPELLENSMTIEYKEHRAIVAALADHQPELAVERTIIHLTNRGRELEEYLGVPKDLVRLKETRILPLLKQFTRT
jgi:DNA-binding GntR family transcriptional regulator